MEYFLPYDGLSFYWGRSLFAPGSHLVVIQYLYISAIIFQGLTLWPIVISILFILMYRIHPFSQMHFPDYPYLHSDVYNGIISAIIVSLLLERYVTRYKNRQEVLDRKIKYKGVKTDIFLHDLKNQIQIAMSKTDDAENFQGILKSIQNFNSTMKTDSISFTEVIEKLKIKMEFKIEIEYEGSEEFLIDQMDLESILTNLIKSTIKHADKQNKVAKIKIYGRESGFNYQDNIVFENQEYYKIVNLADVTSYPDFIKDNRMLYMTKKLVEYHGGIFTMKKKTTGSYIEINY